MALSIFTISIEYIMVYVPGFAITTVPVPLSENPLDPKSLAIPTICSVPGDIKD
jgi:hypothetical protein